jgi:hypothetical protein
MVYPALLPLMRTPRLPIVDWTEAPADLNGLVRFVERRNLVSARVPSHFNWPLPQNILYVSLHHFLLYPPGILTVIRNPDHDVPRYERLPNTVITSLPQTGLSNTLGESRLRNSFLKRRTEFQCESSSLRSIISRIYTILQYNTTFSM